MELYKYLNRQLIDYISTHNQRESVTEIRLRAECIVQIVVDGITENINHIFITQNELDETFYRLCQKSINVYEDDISNGFVTLSNGSRIGISGEYTYNKMTGKYILKKLNSLNIRIPKNRVCFENQDKLFSLEPKSTIVIGPPHSGKTSLLKLYSSHLSKKYRIAICDERRELYIDNLNCDVISGIPKALAASMATRTLNPQFIVCDEIGSSREAEQILSSANSGVNFICSVHGNDLNSIYRKQGMKKLLSDNVFARAVIMHQQLNKFYIKDIIDV